MYVYACKYDEMERDTCIRVNKMRVLKTKINEMLKEARMFN